MKLSLLPIALCFLLVFLVAPLAAQISSVQIEVNLFQPSVYPEDLTAPGAATVSITLREMNRVSLPGYLRLTLSNNSGQEVSTPLVAETIVNLTPFNTLIFTGPALDRFVRLLGADAGTMNGNGIVFAEGEIQLCAEFYDLDFPFEAPINNADNCSFGFAELHEPPTPLLPVGEEVAIDPLQDAVNFTWAPNYFAGPVINYLTVWDVPREWTAVTPDIIMSSLEPIRQPLRINELNSLNKVWYNSDADLIPGHRYLYQIQATDPTGRARFRNNGYSRPEFFDYVSPAPFVDRLCYEPERLTVTENNGSHTVWWTGYPLDSVDHSITLLTLPERGFVQLSELITTPTFPARRLVNGGPTARFSYDISSSLDTTGGRAYLVKLCSICSLTGEEFCKEVTVGTPREPGPDNGPAPTDSTLVCGLYPAPELSLTELAATTATVGWDFPADFAGSLVLSWSGPENSGVPADSTVLSATTRSQALTGLVPNTGYTATLCVVCPDGARSCFSESFSTPADDCPTEDDILAGVTVSALPPDRIVVDWSGTVPGSDPNGWSATISDGSEESASETDLASPTRTAPAAAPTDTPSAFTADFDELGTAPAATPASSTFSALDPSSSYVITVCYACPGDSTVCADWPVDLSGSAECLTSLNFTRPDSTDTTLDLAWSYDPNTVSATDSFTLNWQLADGGGPEHTATLTYAAAAFTITDRTPGEAYTLRVCAECTVAQTTCRDLPPFGGCVAEYLPELVDLRGRRALLSWSGDDRDLETQVRYGIRNLGGWENAQPVNSQNFTAANYDRPEDQLVQTERLYAMTYVGQARTACADTLWSEWSAPILFSPSCALALTDSLYVWEITDSSALVTGQVMPQARNYIFSYRQAGSSEWILSTDRSTPDLLLTELSADTEYDVKMRYRCGGGVWSNFSQVFTFRTLTPCAAPENISFADVTASSAVISWTSGNYAETTLFRYRIAGGSGAWQTVTFAGNSGTLTELAPGEAYEIEAVSHCAANSSYVSAPQTLVLDCAPPELRVTAITVSSAQLQAFGLSPAAASNGFAYRVVGAADWILIDSAYLTGLDDLTEYEARARTTCTSGENSEWSNPVRFQTPVDCRVPNELGVTSLSSVSAGLRWATTGSNERWEIRLLEEGAAGRVETLEQTATIGIEDIGGGFDVESGGGIYGGGGVYNNPTPPDPYADWRLITSDSPEVLVEGLKAYTDYRIVVRTYCPTNGWTDYSEDLLLRTLCVTQPADSLYADQILEDRARLRFQPDTRCQIENEIVLEHPETLYSAASTQSVWYHTFADLEPNTVYRFKVRTKAASYAFTPAANGYTSMADVGVDAGARVVGEAGWTAFSAWQTFRTDDCAPPYDFVENTLDQSTIEITWAASNGINTYEFKYKLADDLGADWAYLNVSEPYVRLENILRGTLYDYQVTELCQNGETFRPAPQDTFLLKRASRNNGFYACGVESDVDLSNEVPLGSLAAGDTITAFDFPVVITSVSGSGGTFSGEGEIRVPYFNKAKATFSFDGIFVNDDYQMKGGKLVAIGAGVEVLPPWADELLTEVMGALQMLDAYLEDEQLEIMDSLMSCCSATLPAELRQRIFDLQNCYAAQAEQGTPNYSLCADMLEALMADIQAFLDAIYGGTFQVAFAAAPDQTYGFDGYNDGDGGRRQNWYETDTLAKEPYPIAFKSIKAGGSDQVLAEIPFSDGPTNVYQDSVGYEMPTGTIPDFSYPGTTATTATITVPAASGTDENFFLAATQIDPATDTVPPFIAGLLDVIPYEELTPTLRIIETTPGALAGLDRDAVEQRIRDIYAQAIVKPSVEYVRFAEAGDYIPQDYEAPLQAVPSGWLTPYTQQMKAFRRNYLDQETPQDDEYIFFVFGKNASGEDSFESTDRLGFMPPGRRFSFIYRNDNKNTNVADFGRTIAHELGHGAYVLRHPWTENDDRYVAQGESRNLMDENGGTELWKWQWDLIHDPEGAPWLPGDEDGESASNLFLLEDFEPVLLPVIAHPVYNPCYITPSGALISFNNPAKLKNIEISYGPEPAEGILTSFEYAGRKYKSITQRKRESKPFEVDTFAGYLDAIKFDVLNSITPEELPTSIEVAEIPDIYLPNSVFTIKNNCTVITRMMSSDCREEWYRWEAISNFRYKDPTINSVDVPPTAELLETDDPVYTLLTKGAGKNVFDYAIATGYETNGRNCDVLRQIAIEIDSLNPILFGHNSEESWSTHTEVQKYFYENYSDWGYTIHEYLANLKKYRKRIEKVKDGLKDVSDQYRAAILMTQLDDVELSTLPLEERIRLLKVLTSESMSGDIFSIINTNNPESAAVRLINTVPRNQQAANEFLERFRSSGLLESLDYRLDDIGWPYDDENHRKYISALTQLIELANPVSHDEAFINSLAPDVTNVSTVSKVFHWGREKLTCLGEDLDCPIKYESEIVDGRLRIKITPPVANIRPGITDQRCICAYPYSNTEEYDPYEWVMITSSADVSYTDDQGAQQRVLSKGEAKFVPALVLHYLATEDKNKGYRLLANTGVDVLFLVVGLYELRAASGVVRAIALIDVVAQTGDISMNLLEESIRSQPGGAEFMATYHKVSLVIGLATVGGGLSAGKLRELFEGDIKKVADGIEEMAPELRRPGMSQQRKEALDKLEDYATDLRRFGDETVDAILSRLKDKFISAGADQNAAEILAGEWGQVFNSRNLPISAMSDDLASIIVQLSPNGEFLLNKVGEWPKNLIEAFSSEAGEFADFFKQKASNLDAWRIAEEAGVEKNVEELGRISSYIEGNPNKPINTIANDVAYDGSVKRWIEETISASVRGGEPKLSKTLTDLGFPNSGTAVSDASKVNANNKAGLDSPEGDPDIPNAVDDYSATRNNIDFVKDPDESFSQYFDRLENSGLFNTFQSHHVLPVNLFKKSEGFRIWFEKVGHEVFSLNGKLNGENNLENLLMLEQFSGGKGVHAKHDAYNDAIIDVLNARWQRRMTDAQNDVETAADFFTQDVTGLAQNLKNALVGSSLRSGNKVDDLFTSFDINTLLPPL